MNWTYPNAEAFGIAVFGHQTGVAVDCYCLYDDVRGKLAKWHLWQAFIDEFQTRRCKTTPIGDFYAPDVESVIWFLLPKS